MGRQSHAAIERIKKIGSMSDSEAVAFLMAERGQTSQKCSVQLCGCTAACEIAIEGEWFPVCRAHATNRLAPRRALSNDPSSATAADSAAASAKMGMELRRWLDAQTINGDNIGEIRRRCFMPWDSEWNALVRDETAKREKSPNREGSHD